MYRKLSIVEIVFYDEGHYMDSGIERIIIEKFKKILEQLYCISVVVRGELNNESRLKDLILNIKDLGIPISLTCVKSKNFSFLESLKYLVSQIRIETTSQFNLDASQKMTFDRLKTLNNNIVFLVELDSTEKARSLYTQLKNTPFIYNATYNHSVDCKCYKEIAHLISKLKTKYTQKLFYEFTCAGVCYDNIKGICPARNILMCIGINGNVQYCYRDTNNHSLEIFGGDFNELFIDLTEAMPLCQKTLCGDKEYKECLGGCPIDMVEGMNKYCIYKK